MKRQNSKSAASIAATNERRKFVRATLVGSALVSPKSGAKAITAVLDNVNRVGAGLHTKEKLAIGPDGDRVAGVSRFRSRRSSRKSSMGQSPG